MDNRKIIVIGSGLGCKALLNALSASVRTSGIHINEFSKAMSGLSEVMEKSKIPMLKIGDYAKSINKTFLTQDEKRLPDKQNYKANYKFHK